MSCRGRGRHAGQRCDARPRPSIGGRPHRPRLVWRRRTSDGLPVSAWIRVPAAQPWRACGPGCCRRHRRLPTRTWGRGVPDARCSSRAAAPARRYAVGRTRTTIGAADGRPHAWAGRRNGGRLATAVRSEDGSWLPLLRNRATVQAGTRISRAVSLRRALAVLQGGNRLPPRLPEWAALWHGTHRPDATTGGLSPVLA